jgi:putative flippase GtrA
MTTETTRFMRFVVVGASNTVLTLVAYTLLSRAGVVPALASALAFSIGAVNGYLLNRSWTFHSRGGAGTLGRYIAVQAVGALASAAGVALASSDLSLRKLAAECLVIPLVTLMTYTLSRTLVFRASAPL